MTDHTRHIPRSRAHRLRLAAVGLGAAHLVFSLGCVEPFIVATAGLSVAQVGSAAYVRGELDSSWAAPLPVVKDAVRAALDTLEFPLEREDRNEDGDRVVFYSRTIDDRDINIVVNSVTDRVTRIAIRAGFWGDQSLSRLILIEIAAELRKRVPYDAAPPLETGQVPPL